MIKHIVFFRLAEFAMDKSRSENASRIKTLLEAVQQSVVDICTSKTKYFSQFEAHRG